MTIPEGYMLVPVDVYNRFFKNMDWVDTEEPTMSDVEKYLEISSSKIRSDMRNIDCPLKQTYKGAKGKGNQKRFTKESVEAYKKWLMKIN
ncbi:hypothetical protein [Chryseobacterium sp. YIM B08800]|uniref:hypothetical protein n=1 Tax=Chryseobacterium sp. YIM B08800 TaxID=2984136 RepID=UPI00223FAE0B|nr:hypothetical protein [Chryseobacterium sp. YIM B08800]